MADPRSGRRYVAFRAKVRAVHAARGLPCSLCGRPIDYGRVHPDRLAWSLEHVIPLWRGGQTFDVTNVAAAHFGCNASKGAREGNALRRLKRRRLSGGVAKPVQVQESTSMRW